MENITYTFCQIFALLLKTTSNALPQCVTTKSASKPRYRQSINGSHTRRLGRPAVSPPQYSHSRFLLVLILFSSSMSAIPSFAAPTFTPLPDLSSDLATYNTSTKPPLTVACFGSSIGTLPNNSGKTICDTVTSSINNLINPGGGNTYNITEDNESVVGTVASQFPTAWNAMESKSITPSVCVFVYGMNDGAVAEYNSGQAFTGFLNGITSAVQKCTAAHADSIIITSPDGRSVSSTNTPKQISLPTDLPSVYPNIAAPPVNCGQLVPSCDQGIINVASSGTSIYSNLRFLEVNSAMRQLAAQTGSLLIDSQIVSYQTILGDVQSGQTQSQTEDAFYGPDPNNQVHPNAQGMTQFFTNAVTNTFAAIGNGIPTSTVLTGATTFGSSGLTVADPLSGSGSVVQQGSGTLLLLGKNTYTGGTIVNGGTIAIVDDSGLGAPSSSLTLSNGTLASYGMDVISTRSVTLVGTGTLSVPIPSFQLDMRGPISGDGSLIKNGPGILVLSGANTYTGGTSVLAGTLVVGSSSSLGSGALSLAAGTNFVMNSSATFANTANISGANTFSLNGNTVTWNGAITDGTAPGALNITGGGTLNLTAKNTYTGGTSVLAGTLIVGSSSSLGSGALSLATGTNLVINSSATFANAANISGASTFSLNGNTVTWNGVITDGTAPGALNITGGGTLYLTAKNTYTGGTSILAGSVILNGSLPGAVSVASGATFGGTGSVGSLTVTPGATLRLGNGSTPGTLTVAGNLKLTAGSTTVFHISPTAADTIIVSGAASLGGTLQIIGAGPEFIGQRYTVLNAAGGITGTFQTLSLGLGILGQIDYSGQNVYLTLKAQTITLPKDVQARNLVNTAAGLNAAIVKDNAYEALASISGQTGSALTASLSQLSGESNLGALANSFEMGRQFLDLLLSHFQEPDGYFNSGGTNATLSQGAQGLIQTYLGYTPHAQVRRPLEIWISGYGESQKSKGDAVALGTHDSTNEGQGIAIGADLQIGRQSSIGAALGWSKTNWSVTDNLGYGNGNMLQIGVRGGEPGRRKLYQCCIRLLALQIYNRSHCYVCRQ